jgi:predicted nucleic acid-binding protein
VVEELDSHGGSSPDWLDVVHVDALAELVVLSDWIGRVSSATHSKGEATVLTWAQVHGAIAIIDDADARKVGQAHGLKVHGSL